MGVVLQFTGETVSGWSIRRAGTERCPELYWRSRCSSRCHKGETYQVRKRNSSEGDAASRWCVGLLWDKESLLLGVRTYETFFMICLLWVDYKCIYDFCIIFFTEFSVIIDCWVFQFTDLVQSQYIEKLGSHIITLLLWMCVIWHLSFSCVHLPAVWSQCFGQNLRLLIFVPCKYKQPFFGHHTD